MDLHGFQLINPANPKTKINQPLPQLSTLRDWGVGLLLV
jgi:hypothetical protein